jgi:hypothetical protein
MTSCHSRRTALSAPAAAALLLLAGCGGDAADGGTAVAGERPDATVEMHQVQAAYIGSVGGGSGVLHYRSRNYPFTVAGAGIGGIGASTLEAEGEVYHLRDISQFAGSYGQARRGIAIGSASTGDLWLQNEAGVVMHLRARRTGLMLSLGADAVVISMRP